MHLSLLVQEMLTSGSLTEFLTSQVETTRLKFSCFRIEDQTGASIADAKLDWSDMMILAKSD